jgi:hypothetical protein
MTTWTDETTTETSWTETAVGTQIIDLIDNDYNFNYPNVNINGFYFSNWTEESLVETAWAEG